MKTKYFFLAAAAALFAACSSDDGIAEQQQQVQQQAGQVPVAFDAYANRGTTRAGQTGEMTNDAESIKNSGFGVFAYYTNADSYDASSFTPNFMYNQKVFRKNSAWTYTPLKYWPNEFGGNALSEDVDKVSFFAYAPYVEVTPASGKVKGDITKGIVGMTKNSSVGDPMVKYISTFYTDEQVDLVWGTVANDQTWATKQSNDATPVAMTSQKGLPWLNIEHPYQTSQNDESRVKFNFLHALASLNVTVDTKVNDTDPADPAAETKVYIRSVTFEGFDTKGALNLNNTKATEALWYNFNCEDELNNGAEITIKDGRKDGKEGVTAATSEYAAINPTFVQSTVWGSTSPAQTAGVTHDPGNLFRLNTAVSSSFVPSDDAPIYVIPNGDPLKVTIEYDVLTKDANVAGKLNDGQTPGSVVKNVITRYISTAAGANGWGTIDGESNSMTLQNGKKYIVKLHLGLNSVEFEANVEGWVDAENPNGEADLPHNN